LKTAKTTQTNTTTIGIDLGDKSNETCTLNESGEVIERGTVLNNQAGQPKGSLRKFLNFTRFYRLSLNGTSVRAESETQQYKLSRFPIPGLETPFPEARPLPFH